MPQKPSCRSVRLPVSSTHGHTDLDPALRRACPFLLADPEPQTGPPCQSPSPHDLRPSFGEKKPLKTQAMNGSLVSRSSACQWTWSCNRTFKFENPIADTRRLAFLRLHCGSGRSSRARPCTG
mmetsp:Transcript_49436/g.100904  ORF Transcript_49436/g.100904 Transcript_49436/m.100904 type:complete len:123 (+) Transcript_49436:394-762(+)